MSTTKIIKGWVSPSMQLDTEDFGIIELLDHPAKHGDVTLAATLYIGTGKLWTEEEVRAMFDTTQMVARLAAKSSNKPEDWQEIVEADFNRIAAKHGLTL